MNPAYLRPVADHLWQSSIFAGAAGLLTLALRKNRARLRHWLWLIASCKFLIPLSILFALGGQLAWRTTPPKAPPSLPAVVQQVSQPFTSPDVSAPLSPPAPSQFPAIFLAIWACGFAAIGFSWWIRWLRIHTAVRNASPVPLEIPIPAKYSPAHLEPSVFGVFRPVLLLPEGIFEHLTPAQLRAVITHELCHVRYRDNLAAAIQMFVETVFWFYPPVWWIGKRMTGERERACDEEVLALGNKPDSYAEAILKVCRFCLESPLPCASGIAGSGLRRRIEAILNPSVIHRLHPTKRLVLAAFAFAAVAGPLAIGLFRAPGAHAQEPAPARMAFDVVSIKPFQGTAFNFAIQRSGGRIRWTNNLMGMVMYAYRIGSFKVTGMPHLADFYAIDAETSPDATDDQIRLMIQSLLAERFQFQAHREPRRMSGYALAPAKGGVKIKPAAPDAPPLPLPDSWRAIQDKAPGMEGKIFAYIEGPGVTGITARRATMAQFVQILEDQILHAPVVDRTALTGQYYFSIKCIDVNAPADTDSNLPTIFDALQESLGLRLENQTVSVDMLVVEHVEKTPIEN
jgi:bla regulator protein BlaR1